LLKKVRRTWFIGWTNLYMVLNRRRGVSTRDLISSYLALGTIDSVQIIVWQEVWRRWWFHHSIVVHGWHVGNRPNKDRVLSQSAIFSSNNPTKFSQNTSVLVLLIHLHVTAFVHKLQAIMLALTLVSAPEEDPCTEPFGGDGCFMPFSFSLS
jgi:hypothetical protein